MKKICEKINSFNVELLITIIEVNLRCIDNKSKRSYGLKLFSIEYVNLWK